MNTENIELKTMGRIMPCPHPIPDVETANWRKTLNGAIVEVEPAVVFLQHMTDIDGDTCASGFRMPLCIHAVSVD